MEDRRGPATSHSPENGLYSWTMCHRLHSHTAVKAGGCNVVFVHRTGARKAARFTSAFTWTAFGPHCTVTGACTARATHALRLGGRKLPPLVSEQLCDSTSPAHRTHVEGRPRRRRSAPQRTLGPSSRGCSPGSRASGHLQTGRLLL